MVPRGSLLPPDVFNIHLPPLRNRQESIPSLTEHFLDKARKKLNKNIAGIEERAVKAMQHYPWPGNIRRCKMSSNARRSLPKAPSSGWKTFPPSLPTPTNDAAMERSIGARPLSRPSGNCK